MQFSQLENNPKSTKKEHSTTTQKHFTSNPPFPMAGINRENITDYGELLIRDYLSSKGYTNALEALTQDIALESFSSIISEEKKENSLSAQQQKEARSVDSWYILNQKFNLPSLLNRNAVSSSKNFGSVLEVLVDAMVQQKMSDAQQQSETPTYLKVSRAEESVTEDIVRSD